MWPPPPIKPNLLIAIAILPVLLFCAKQTWAQEPATEAANGMPSAPTTAVTGKTYGLGAYTMDEKEQTMVPDDAKLLNTTEDVKNYKAKNANNQFKPCMMELNKEGKIQLVYDEDAAKHGCTVDLVIGPSEDEKTFRAEITLADPMSCLDDCGENTIIKELVASSANFFPFTYSLSNDEFENLHNGPPYKEDQTSCREKCAKKGGKCMASATSLQLAWNKCETKVEAWIQLVGEPNSAWSMEQEANEKAAIDLIIARGKNPNVSMQIEGGDKTVFPNDNDGKPVSPSCFTDNNLAMIPELKFWTIKSDNAQLNGKHLLVFHLLPQKATRTFDNEGMLQNAPGPGMPKCKGKLAIAFENVAGLLQSPIGSPTPPKTTPSGATGPRTSGATGPTTSGANEPTTGETMEPTSNLGVIIEYVAGAVVLLIIVGMLVWYFCCRDKEGNEEDAEAGANTEKESVPRKKEQRTSQFQRSESIALVHQADVKDGT